MSFTTMIYGLVACMGIILITLICIAMVIAMMCGILVLAEYLVMQHNFLKDEIKKTKKKKEKQLLNESKKKDEQTTLWD